MNELVNYSSDAEIAHVAEKFESCAFGSAEFTHARHLTVLVWYLSHHSGKEALDAMRTGLLRFSAHHDVPTLYHETITAFWVQVVDTFLRGHSQLTPLYTLANEVVSTYGNKDFIFAYYSRDRLLSPEARANWLEPDLRPLDVPSAVNRVQSTVDG